MTEFDAATFQRCKKHLWGSFHEHAQPSRTSAANFPSLEIRVGGVEDAILRLSSSDCLNALFPHVELPRLAACAQRLRSPTVLASLWQSMKHTSIMLYEPHVKQHTVATSMAVNWTVFHAVLLIFMADVLGLPMDETCLQPLRASIAPPSRISVEFGGGKENERCHFTTKEGQPATSTPPRAALGERGINDGWSPTTPETPAGQRIAVGSPREDEVVSPGVPTSIISCSSKSSPPPKASRRHMRVDEDEDAEPPSIETEARPTIAAPLLQLPCCSRQTNAAASTPPTTSTTTPMTVYRTRGRGIGGRSPLPPAPAPRPKASDGVDGDGRRTIPFPVACATSTSSSHAPTTPIIITTSGGSTYTINQQDDRDEPMKATAPPASGGSPVATMPRDELRSEPRAADDLLAARGPSPTMVVELDDGGAILGEEEMLPSHPPSVEPSRADRHRHRHRRHHTHSHTRHRHRSCDGSHTGNDSVGRCAPSRARESALATPLRGYHHPKNTSSTDRATSTTRDNAPPAHLSQRARVLSSSPHRGGPASPPCVPMTRVSPISPWRAV